MILASKGGKLIPLYTPELRLAVGACYDVRGYMIT
jgi:hypothetical protein